MKREVKGSFTFECGQHKVPLVGVDGVPTFAPEYEDDAVEPNGKYQIDFGGVTCPVLAAAFEAATTQEAMDSAFSCIDSWRVWLDPDA